jgi:hypothetical protein
MNKELKYLRRYQKPDGTWWLCSIEDGAVTALAECDERFTYDAFVTACRCAQNKDLKITCDEINSLSWHRFSIVPIQAPPDEPAGSFYLSEAFYLVFNPDKTLPKVMHSTREAADNEAERLARKHHTKIYVCKAVACVGPVDAIEWREVK